jgi:hypothetical protein
MFDRFQSLWKLQNTVVTPGFHVQNSVSNMFQSYLDIGADALNPNKLRRAYAVWTTKDPKQFVTLGGKKYSYKELEYMAKKSGVIDELFHEYEFKYGLEEGMLKKAGIPDSLDPTNVDEFFAYKLGTKMGTKIEATQRMNLFMSALDQGATLEEAVERVNKFLFDYGDLTEFEQNVMKRVIPFYTFMKKNVPMELEMMMEKPQVFATLNKANENISKMNESEYQGEHERTEWRQDDVQLPFNMGGESYGVTDNLPYSQFERVFDLNKLLGQTSPALKIPAEQATQQTLYTEMPIEDYGEYFENQLYYPKFLNMLDKKDGSVEKANYVLGQMTGFPINQMKEPYTEYTKTK